HYFCQKPQGCTIFLRRDPRLQTDRPTLRGAQAFKVADGIVVIYESQFAGTNQATAVTWALGEHFDDMVKALDEKDVPFEHYAMPGITLQGHVHVVQDGSPSRVAWFKDPDGNLHNLNNGSPAPAK